MQTREKVVDLSHERPSQYFFIRSCMNNKLMTAGQPGKDDGEPGPGSMFRVYPKLFPPSDRQLFYFDHKHNLRSKINGYCLDATSEWVRLGEYDPNNTHAQWTYCAEGPRFFLKHCRDLVIDIRGESSRDDAEVIIYRYKGSSNQHWMLDYNISEIPDEEAKDKEECSVM